MPIVPFEETSIMPKVGGKSFCCTCGANVFHHPKMLTPRSPIPDGNYNREPVMDTDIFECNGCGLWYHGE
jgi:hypothetical protein